MIFFAKKRCEWLLLPINNAFWIESRILFACVRCGSLHSISPRCSSLQNQNFLGEKSTRSGRHLTPRSRMVRTRKHQRPRKIAFSGINPSKHKKSRKWLINLRDFSSILYDFQPIFVGISVYWWALECKNYFPMQHIYTIDWKRFSLLIGTTHIFAMTRKILTNSSCW